MERKIHSIYRITNQVNQKVYIGQSVDYKQRWRQHQLESKREIPSMIINQAMKKYGIEYFTFEIIASCIDQDAANEAEELFIKQYDSHVSNGKGYNVSLGGSVAPKTEEWKQKVKATRITNDSYKQSEETKQKMSEEWSLYHSPESMKKTHQANTGRIPSAEQRRKVAEANKGNQYCLGHKQSEETIKKRVASILAKHGGPRVCSVSDCGKSSQFIIEEKRYCNMHGQRLRNTGSLELRKKY